MNVAILHNAVTQADLTSDRDVLVQVEAVEAALQKLGHATRRLACTLNLELVEESLAPQRPSVVFNLVESLGGSDRLAHLAAVLLDDLDLPYTGTPSTALHLTNNKPSSKERLRAAGLPTPDWRSAADRPGTILPPPYIIKSVWEHASVGLDDHAVIRDGDGSTVVDQIESRSRQLGQTCFAERFIEGRELNLSLIAGNPGPHILPPAEIDFSAFPEGKPRIVGYAAKWEERAFEFMNTPRTFEFRPDDAPLLDWLRSLALECWRLFGLRGYARVDFRVDAAGQPWILEINANPCLSPDAGFAAALGRAGIPLERAIAWILEDALGSRKSAPTPFAPSEASTNAAEKQKKPKRRSTAKVRSTVDANDAHVVRRIVESTGLFRPAEVDVACELVETRLSKGTASGYEFAFADLKSQSIGYVCFGPNPVTVSSWDLYWIAVDKTRQGQGIGRMLMDEAERRIQAAGGKRVYIETSQRADYLATRGFYERCGYSLSAVLDDYYAPGDSKAIYVKLL